MMEDQVEAQVVKAQVVGAQVGNPGHQLLCVCRDIVTYTWHAHICMHEIQ